jgi:hypothetical protein
VSLQTSRDMYSHSLAMAREHPKLLVFALLNMATWLGLLAWFLPALFQATAADVWHQTIAGRHVVNTLARLSTRELWDLPLVWLGGFFMIGMLATNLIRFAFCSQAIRALNGDSVSVLEGLSLAINRLPVIGPWALLASTAGAVVSFLERIFGWVVLLVDVVGVSLAMRKLTILPSLLGVPWNVSAQFVLPAMLKEPDDRSPIEYLRISARMVRRVWGDALVIGVIGPSVVGFLFAGGVFGLALAASRILDLEVLTLWGALAGLVIYSLTDCVNGVFRCSLYVYATEGVAPGPFDANLLDRAWNVR